LLLYCIISFVLGSSIIFSMLHNYVIITITYVITLWQVSHLHHTLWPMWSLYYFFYLSLNKEKEKKLKNKIKENRIKPSLLSTTLILSIICRMQIINNIWLQLIYYISTYYISCIFQRRYLGRLRETIYPKIVKYITTNTERECWF